MERGLAVLAECDERPANAIALIGMDIQVNTSMPTTFFVRGINPYTGETKNYLLRVTKSGKLLLQ